MQIKETLNTPIKYECDVLVCGGGVAGIAAACAAARSGKKVILAERGFMLGGLATSGLVTVYLPLCDGFGKQIFHGLAEELLRLSISVYCDGKRGYGNWIASDDISRRTEKDARFEVNFNPNLFAISAERLLISEGVKILYGTVACSAFAEKGKVSAVIFENKSGRFAIKPISVVDCTGDGDIAYFGGAPMALFKQGNVLASWYYFYGKDGYGLNMLGYSEIPDELKNGEEVSLLDNRRFGGTDGEEISEFMCASHSSIMRDVLARRKDDNTLEPTSIASIPQLRMTRRIDGEYILDRKESKRHFLDSIGMVSDWRKRGPVYEVPFSMLYSAKLKNLLCAGRCVSVTDSMWDIMRVIPCCAVTGEAAGIAAAAGDDMTKLDVNALQQELTSRGVIIHGDFF